MELSRDQNRSTWDAYQGCRRGERPQVRDMGLCTLLQTETPETALDLMQNWWKAWKSPAKDTNRDYQVCTEQWPGPHCTWELVGWQQLGKLNEELCNHYRPQSKKLGVCKWEGLAGKDLEEAMRAWWREEMVREGRRKTSRSIIHRVRACRNGEKPERRATGACNWLLGKDEEEGLFFMKEWWNKRQGRAEDRWRINQQLEPKTQWGRYRRREQCQTERWKKDCPLLVLKVRMRNSEVARRRDKEKANRAKAMREKRLSKKRQLQGTSLV